MKNLDDPLTLLRRVRIAFRLASGRISGVGGAAERLGVSVRTVSRWVNSDPEIRKIAEACNYKPAGGNPKNKKGKK